ncbi:hypothetical protein ACFRAU_06730 [Arthrobacter sp. NPDC056691]|uniref:hypothetical protein n=1 Tax=Arthrobacter sp. NPDC056691 TaxID=3345913 RepID=UPI00366BB0B3
MGKRWVFDGHIAGIGTASGLRAVVGIWQESFIATTYRFEEVRFVEVSAVAAGKSLTVDAGPLVIRAATGGRALLGALLRTVPRPLAVHTR